MKKKWPTGRGYERKTNKTIVIIRYYLTVIKQ